MPNAFTNALPRGSPGSVRSRWAGTATAAAQNVGRKGEQLAGRERPLAHRVRGHAEMRREARSRDRSAFQRFRRLWRFARDRVVQAVPTRRPVPMVRGVRVALGVVVTTATGGALVACAVITGLNRYSDDEGSVDGTVAAARDAPDVRFDGVSATDAVDRFYGVSATDAMDRGDARVDVADAREERESGRAGGVDAQGGCGDATLVPDCGCETSLSSVTGCGACGRACDTATGKPSCNGTTCSYACNSGRADCNASIAPDTDGCECATPGCCSGACQVVHSNGEGQSFYDCAPLGTYTQTQATEACTAFTNDSVQCTLSSTFCSSSTYAVCSVSASTCRCWQYSGPNPGTVQSPSLGCSAQCGSASDPPWN